MYEVDFLPVGKAGRPGDAITLRFNRPDTGTMAHVIVDAGFQDTGQAVVDHVREYYRPESVDLAILTHPDGDHIGGMGTVIRQLHVETLAIHRLGARGGRGLDAADAVDDLIGLAKSRGVRVVEPFTGDTAFNGALTFLGPNEGWYAELVQQQQLEEGQKSAAPAPGLLEAARRAGQQVLAALPIEIPFDDAGGTSPRNNTSMICLLDFGGHTALLTGDAGVPALERAWQWLETNRGASPPDFVQIPHHGSRRNASSDVLDRILGPTGQVEHRTAFVSTVADDPKHPSPRVVNAYKRRGYRWYQTAGKAICHPSPDAPARINWDTIEPGAALDESLEED